MRSVTLSMNLPLPIISLAKSLFVNRYTGFLLFLFGYTALMERFFGFPALLTAWRFEIPLLLYVYFYLNLITRSSRLQPVVTALPIILLYTVFDVYHLQLGRLLRLAEVDELPEMIEILPLWTRFVLGFVVALPLLGLLLSLQWRRFRILLAGALPLVALVVAVEVFPESFMTAFERTQKEILLYSDVMSAENNGRISMALYNEARRKSLLARTAHYRDNPFYLIEMEKMAQAIRGQRARRNVHLIVLESFLDPELMLDATFSRRPMHPEFEKIFKRKGGFSISPVYGGGTAQAEFELLCGVPAMRELSGVEFNVFTGAKTSCLPNVLTEGGYHTIATNAFRPDFFNSTNAYAGIGFDNAYYPSEYAAGRESYFSTGDVTGEKYMFDGELLGQNLKYVEYWLRENAGKPLFNYVITMYGHTPHEMNAAKRPNLITVKGPRRDEHFERSVNQYYYRTEAIAAYVRELVRVDPKSLIILVSDHVPPLTHGPYTYRDLNYLDKMEGYLNLNRIFFIENGKTVQLNTIHHYDVPQIILNYVTNGKKSRDFVRDLTRPGLPFDLAVYRQAYLTIMAQAMNIKKLLPALPAAAESDEASAHAGTTSPPAQPLPR